MYQNHSICLEAETEALGQQDICDSLVNLGTRMSWEVLVNFGIQRQLARMQAYKENEPRQPTIHEG